MHIAERLFPEAVAQGLIQLPPPPRPTPRAQAMAEASARLYRRHDPACQRMERLAVEFVTAGPHPHGAFKAYCTQHGLHYAEFFKYVDRERKKRRRLSTHPMRTLATVAAPLFLHH